MTNSQAPLIGLSIYNTGDKYHYFPKDYISAVRAAGGVPLLLPPNEPNLEQIMNSLDGLVLTGGGDINPAVYGGKDHPAVYWINDSQDESEQKLAEIALGFDKPILATCRGMQIINVLLGGTLYLHLPDVYGEQVNHRLPGDKPVDHEINLVSDSKLASLLNTTRFSAKSWHHQSISELAQGFRAVGFAEDGVIEAIESDKYANLIAIQWHPEIGTQDNSVQQKLFDGWVRQCLAGSD